jgi:hypothetical protein
VRTHTIAQGTITDYAVSLWTSSPNIARKNIGTKNSRAAHATVNARRVSTDMGWPANDA